MHTLGTFEVIPSKAKFGILKQGYVYQTNITLVNVGLDSTRYRIKPPKSNRIIINYRKGPLAPGLKLTVEVLIDARELDSDQICTIKEDIEIISESEYLYVPVAAEIHADDSSDRVGKLLPQVTVADSAKIQI